MKRVVPILLALIMTLSSLTAFSAEDESPFTDVSTSRWSFESILYAVNAGYMNGVGGGRFSPTGNVTRAMVVTVLYRREGSPAVTFRNDFKDVPAGKYYSDAVIWAKDEGVVNGTSDTTFSPDRSITREQLATMLFRFSSRSKVSVPERADLSGYPDSDKIGSFASEALAWAGKAGLINGLNDGTLSPKGNATREQFATIMKRYDDAFILKYNSPVLLSRYTQKEIPLVTDADFYVATDGDDSNDGSFAHPFASWQRAAEAVKSVPKTKEKGQVTVAFKAGNYGHIEVSLTSEDSGTEECPVIYTAYGDGEVIFDNGAVLDSELFVPISEDEYYLFKDKSRGDIKKLDISDIIPVGEYDLSYIIFSDKGLCAVARFPNRNADGTDNLLGGYTTSDENHIRLTLPTFKNKMASYHTVENVKLYGYLTTGWYKDTLSVGEYNKETGDCLILDPEKARPGSLRYGEFDPGTSGYGNMAILNASEELDGEGEYWVDPSSCTLYMYKPEGSYHLVKYDRMIEMNNTAFITINSMSFKNTRDRFLYFGHCHDINITGNSFSSSGGMYAVRIESGKPVHTAYNFNITDNTFDLAYDCFLYARVKNLLIDNNSFTNYNLFLNEESAMYLSHCDGAVVSHNEFINGGRGAVFYGGSQNVIIEYNYAKNQMVNAADGGVFCSWNDIFHRGNKVRYNIVADVASKGVGGFGLYLDDIDAGTEIYSNLFYNLSGFATVVHDGRDNIMRDNIVVNPAGSASAFRLTSINLEGVSGYDDLSDGLKNYYNQWVSVFAGYESNPEMKEYALEHWPEIFDVSTDFADIGKSTFALNSNNTITGNLFINRTANVGVDATGDSPKYSTIENNTGALLSENPVFVNPSLGDYRIRSDAGFPDIQFEKIGRY